MIQSVEPAVIKPKVVVLFDASGSVESESEWNTQIDIATEAVRKLEPVAEVMFVPFADRKLASTVYTNPEEVLSSLAKSRLSSRSKTKLKGGLTALRDAMVFATTGLKLGPKDALLAITDGWDNASRVSPSEMENVIVRAGVRVFAVLPRQSGPDISTMRESIRTLEKWATDTGGRAVWMGTQSFGSNPEFLLNPREHEQIATMVRMLANLIVSPYEMKLMVPNDVSGKLKIDVIDEAGRRRKDVQVSAPERLEAQSYRQ